MLIFSHPDYTVGTGFSPAQLLLQVTDSRMPRSALPRTVSRASNHRRSGICTLPLPRLLLHHPAPKNSLFFFTILLYAYRTYLSIPFLYAHGRLPNHMSFDVMYLNCQAVCLYTECFSVVRNPPRNTTYKTVEGIIFLQRKINLQLLRHIGK